MTFGVKKIAITNILTKTYFGNELQTYLIFLLIVAGSIVIARIFFWIVQKFVKAAAARTKTNLDDILVDMLEEPATVYIVSFFIYLGWKFFDWTTYPSIDRYFGHLMYTVMAINTGWLVSRLSSALIENYLKPLTAKSKTDLDDYLVPILNKLLNLVIFAVAIIMILDHFGQEIGPMLAGLGIGGLAFALAAKDLLSNLFGSATVILDKPFSLGERIKIEGQDGIVKEINLRTTKIQTLDGRIVFIPNAKFTDGILENVTQEWARKVSMTIGVVYDTDAKGMKKAKEIITKAISKHKGTDNENMFVSFDSFGDYSKNIQVIYWIIEKGYGNIIRVKDEINTEIMVEFEKAKISMAFPTQTIELKK